MKKRLFLIRHGETLKNSKGVVDGVTSNLSLSQKGKNQADTLGKHLSMYSFDAIYSSPLKRAIQTAKRISFYQDKKLHIHILPKLREINFGKAEGKTLEQLNTEYGLKTVNSFLWATLNTWDFKFPGKGSESKHEAFKRAYKAIFEILDSSYTTVAIISHAGIINAIATGLNLKGMQYGNCTINIIEWDTESKQFCLL